MDFRSCLYNLISISQPVGALVQPLTEGYMTISANGAAATAGAHQLYCI